MLERRVYMAGTPYVLGSEHVQANTTYTLDLFANGVTFDHWWINWGDGSTATTVASSATSATHTFTTAPSDPAIVAKAINSAGTLVARSSLALDPLYGTYGRLATNTDNDAEAIALQSDGKVVALTDSGKLERFNTNGTLDASFGTNGTLTLPSSILWTCLSVASNGDIVLGGNKGESMAMALVNQGGTLSAQGVSHQFGDGGNTVSATDVAYAHGEIAVVGGDSGDAAAAAVFNPSGGYLFQSEVYSTAEVCGAYAYAYEKVAIDGGDGNIDITRSAYYVDGSSAVTYSAGYYGNYSSGLPAHTYPVVDQIQLSPEGTIEENLVPPGNYNDSVIARRPTDYFRPSNTSC